MAITQFKHSEYTAYFKNLCEKYLRQTLHFHRVDVEDFITNSVTGITSDWAFILEGIDFDVREPLSDNPMKMRSCGFMILFKKKVRSKTFAERDTLMDEAEEIADDFFRRIRFDRNRQRSQFFHFAMNTWSVQQINENTLHPDYMGVRVTFTMGAPLLLKSVDETLWNDLT